MAGRSFTALLVTDPANLFYLTGYNAWSFYTPQCLVVPADGELHLFARAMDAAGAAYTCNLRRDQVHGYPEALVHRADLHPFDWIAEQIGRLGLLPGGGGEVVGIEADAAYFTVRGYRALCAGLPGVRMEDSAELVNWVRLVKSEHEIGQLRIAGQIAERAMRVALDAIAVGRRQCDVVAEILAAQAAGTAEHGGDYSAIVPMLPTGDAAGTPHLTWSDARFRAGEATTIELAGGLWPLPPLARTKVLGPPPPRLARTADLVAEGMQAVLAAVAPGTTACRLHAVFDELIRRAGLVKESRIGYSIGIGYPPDGGERTVSLRAEDATVLQPGMAFHVILGIWMEGWGYELSEPIVVTATGAERLTDLPHELAKGT